MNVDMKIIHIHACTRFQMLMAEIFSPKCPLYVCLNPNFVRDANAKVEQIKYARV
jgi:hypothetical protein